MEESLRRSEARAQQNQTRVLADTSTHPISAADVVIGLAVLLLPKLPGLLCLPSLRSELVLLLFAISRPFEIALSVSVGSGPMQQLRLLESVQPTCLTFVTEKF